MSLKKVNSLSQGDKMKIIAAYEAGISRTELMREYSLPSSSFYRIMHQKESILQQCLQGNSNLRRNRSAVFPDIDRCMVEWVHQRLDHNLPIDGPSIQAQAKLFSMKLGIEGFCASNGWLNLFKKRHGLCFNKTKNSQFNGMPVEAGMDADWNKCFTSLLNECDANDVYSVVETGLFYSCLPDQIFSYRDKDCRNGEHRQERVTVLLGCNVTGTDKLPMLIIGQLSRKKCVKELPTQCNYMYKSNWNAWITRDIFQAWLKKVDQTMMEAERHIVLLINHSHVHAFVPNMTNTKVIFYSAKVEEVNAIHHLLLHTFKRNFRTDSISHLLERREKGIELNISIPCTVRIAAQAWDNISGNTIVNCFMQTHCGSDGMQGSSQEQEDDKVDVIWPHQAEPILLLAQDMLEIPSFSDYIRVDKNLVVAGKLSDDNIIEMVKHDRQLEDVMEEEESSTDNEKPETVWTATMSTNDKLQRTSTTVQASRQQSQDVLTDILGSNEYENVAQQSVIRKEDALDAIKKLHDFFSQHNEMDVTKFNVLYDLEMCVRNVKD